MSVLVRFLLLLCGAGIAVQLPAEDIAADYQVQTLVRIPLRDGIHLSATVYRPVRTNGPLPVIFQFTPYPDEMSASRGAYFAAHGYNFAQVHVRGRGDSDGDFDPFVHDGQDGYDVVERFARQPWCNGKVGMFGGSYPGANQWLVAMFHPPHLVTIVPVSSARAGGDYPVARHVIISYMVQWLAFTSGHGLYSQVFRDPELWQSTYKRWYLAKAAFQDLDQYAGSRSEIFQAILKHPNMDEYWRARGGAPEQIAGVHIPVLEITGTNDADENGALSFHQDHDTFAANAEQTYLIIRPWDHGGTRTPQQDIGGEHYGPATMVDLLRLHRQWYDHVMKGAPKPAFLKDHFIYYVGGPGAECWKSAKSLRNARIGSLTLYPDARGGADTIYQSGLLSPTQTGAVDSKWISDPNDLSGVAPQDPEVLDTATQPGGDLHGNGLVFHSAPFTTATKIDGRVDLRLSLVIDAPDTDLRAVLALILPDGNARLLTEATLRARYRYTEEHPEPIHKYEPEEYDLHPFFPFIALRAPKSSQLRLVLTSLNNSAFEKNGTQ